MFKKILIFVLFGTFFTSVQGQNGFAFIRNQENNTQIAPNWQFGVGGGLVKFSDKDVAYIGDKHLVQVPRFNATKRLNNNLSIDGAISFGSFDSATKFIAKNNVPYFSFDVSLRYRYLSSIKKLDPFIFIGGSAVDSDPKRKMTPTFNVGTGVTYWFTEMFGVSGNFYYKHSLESFESMRSHTQATLGVIFGLNIGKGRRRGSSSCYYNQNRKSRKRGSTSCHYNQHRRRR